MSSATKYKKLLEPSYIGKVKTRNRIIKTAATMKATINEGRISDRNLCFYENLAKGGVGLIIVEPTAVDHPAGTHEPTEWYLTKETLPDFKKLTQVIHKQGCPVFVQLMHTGAWYIAFLPKKPLVSSSTMTQEELPDPKFFYSEAREITVPEIKELIKKFVYQAEISREAGFDGIELGASSNHLLNSFLSRIWNKRHDEYGIDSLENRARIVVEIIKAIKEKLGKDFPVMVSLNAAEYGMKNGTTLEESTEFAKMFEAAGADALELRIYGFEEYDCTDFPEEFFYPEPPANLSALLDNKRHGAGLGLPFAAAIKKVVSIPVLSVGRLDATLGELSLLAGMVDFVGMTRRLIADPELPNKVAAGKLEDIAPCTGCMHCLSAMAMDKRVVCRINATLGEDVQAVIKPAAQKKKIMVVGAGPGGMETARVAALRGHEVTLYEKGNKLGGVMPMAAVVKGTEIEDLTQIVRYLEIQLKKLGVKIVMNTEVTPELIASVKPDAVIVATGGVPTVPNIPGIHNKNVVNVEAIKNQLKLFLKIMSPQMLRWCTKFYLPMGKKVVVIGGGIQGCQLAEYLTHRGRQVAIVESAKEIGIGVPVIKWSKLAPWIHKNIRTIVTGAKIEEVTDKGLVITNSKGEKETIPGDTIILALPLTPNNSLLKNLNGKVKNVYAVGDCKEPRLIIDAIDDGNQIARKL